MPFLDAVERWIMQTTGRTLDQHAADPVPAAAHLPASADQLRRARSRLLHAIDQLRTRLINADDLTQPAAAITWTLSDITADASDYESARIHIDTLIADPDRTAYVVTHPVQPVRRRYVKPGDTVLIVLPHLEVNRQQQLAGRFVRARITDSDAELDLDDRPGPVRLEHGLAGIYRDPVESSLYILRNSGERRLSGR